MKDKDWVWAGEYAEIDEFIVPASDVPDIQEFDPCEIDPTYQFSIEDLGVY